MVRNYIRKTDRGLTYTREQLLEAVEKVRSGECNGNQAALRYNIPRTTLNDRLTGKHGLKSQTIGKPPLFPASFEKTLSDNLKTLQNHGFALLKKEILDMVGCYAKSHKMKIPSKSGNPGGCWLSAFAKRHRFSSKPLYVEFGWKDKDVIHVKEFYSIVEMKINELDLADKPQHIWHIEEHSFTNGKRVANTDNEKDFTVVTVCNAKGEKAPLLIVFKGKESSEWQLGKHVNASHKNGFCRAVFKNYFTTVFLSYIDDSHPNLIIYDGQNSHMDIGLVNEARKAKVTLVKSPNLDALDISITETFKVKWSTEAETFAGSSREFANVVANVFDSAEVCEIVAGFRSAGVYPFNTVCDSKFDSTRLKEYEEYRKFKANHLSSKATEVSNQGMEAGSHQQFTRIMELEESSCTTTDVEAIFVPGNMESPKTNNNQNSQSIRTRIAVKKDLTIKQDSEPDVVLSKTEEEQLIAWIMQLNNAGFSITEDKVSDAVYNLMANSKRGNFNKMPNRDWYEEFLKKHPELAYIISKPDSEANSVTVWYDSLQKDLEKRKVSEILNDPSRIFSLGEAALYFYPKELANNFADDEDLTVYITASANGKMQPPSVVFPFKNSMLSNGFQRSMSSWSRAEFFDDQITDIFYHWLTENQIPLPVILLLDHRAPVNLNLSDFCKDKQIILMALPNVQPLETVFQELQRYWKEEQYILQILGKDEMAKEIESNLNKDFGIEIRCGFTRCGFNFKSTL